MTCRKPPRSTSFTPLKPGAAPTTGTTTERSGETVGSNKSETAVTIATLTERSTPPTATPGRWERAVTSISRLPTVNTPSILDHSRPDVPDTLARLNHGETVPPTCRTTATIADPTATTCPTQMARSSRVGSGMFDRLSGSELAKMQQRVSSLIYYTRKRSLFLLCTHTSTKLNYVTCTFYLSVLVENWPLFCWLRCHLDSQHLHVYRVDVPSERSSYMFCLCLTTWTAKWCSTMYVCIYLGDLSGALPSFRVRDTLFIFVCFDITSEIWFLIRIFMNGSDWKYRYSRGSAEIHDIQKWAWLYYFVCLGVFCNVL